MMFSAVRQPKSFLTKKSSSGMSKMHSLDPTNINRSDAIALNNNEAWIGEGKRYRLMERLGGGGMGNVYLAMDTRIGKPVALKLLKESLADDESMRVRFEWELAICATLKSQHIVQVTDYGVTPEGYPFYVMEYLQGQTLGQLLAQEERLSPQRACQIMTQICAGLQIAHEGVIFDEVRGDSVVARRSISDREATNAGERIKVVHRDLKPENIFLVPTALGDLVKIIDFGIAKIRHFHIECTNVTNAFLGTCHYAAPEQIGGAKNLDQRADIYSLGLILYEMLTGYDPFDFDFRQNRVAGESWLVAHTSKVPSPLRSQPGCEHLSSEIEAVVMKCLKKSPKERFSSVDELSQALQAAVLGTPIETSQELKLPLGTQKNNYSTEDEETRDGIEDGETRGTREQGDKGKRNRFRWMPLGVGAIAAFAIGMSVMPKLLTGQTPSVTPGELTTNAREFSVIKTLAGHTDIIWTVALSANGQTLASGSEDRTIKVWNPQTGQLMHTFSGHAGAVRAIALSLDGNLLVSAGSDRTIKMWNLKTDKLIRTLEGHQDTIWSVAISSDRRYLATASADRTIKIWNIHTKELLATFKGHSDWVFSVAFSPDGQTLASASKDGTIKLWDVQKGQEIYTFTGHTEAVRAVAFDPQGQHIASASWDGTVKLWDVETKKELRTFSGHSDRLTSVVFSPDGKTLASSSIDGTVKLWDWDGQKLLGTLDGHGDWVLSLVTDPSGETFVSSSKDKTLKIWRRRS
jgi:WD40 repeat protein